MGVPSWVWAWRHAAHHRPAPHWAAHRHPKLELQESCVIPVLPMVCLCETNPQMSLFVPFRRFERKRGEAMLEQPRASGWCCWIPEERSQEREKGKWEENQGGVPGIVSCTYRKNKVTLPFSVAEQPAMEMLCCKHWKCVCLQSYAYKCPFLQQ